MPAARVRFCSGHPGASSTGSPHPLQGCWELRGACLPVCAGWGFSHDRIATACPCQLIPQKGGDVPLKEFLPAPTLCLCPPPNPMPPPLAPPPPPSDDHRARHNAVEQRRAKKFKDGLMALRAEMLVGR